MVSTVGSDSRRDPLWQLGDVLMEVMVFLGGDSSWDW